MTRPSLRRRLLWWVGLPLIVLWLAASTWLLLRTAHETGARRVIATHGDTDALVRMLNTQGIDTGVFATGYGEDD